MNRQRLGKMAKRVLIALLIAPFLIWVGVTIGAKLTIGKDAPITDLAGMVAEAMFGGLICSVVGCEADLPEGMEIKTFADDLVMDTTVAFDIDERGHVFVAETARQRGGVEDNRSHPYWLMDDLASRTIEDRHAYYEKALAEDRFEHADHFTRYADRIALLEDTDGDDVADRRTVVAEWNEMVSGLIAGVEAREGSIWVTAVPSIHRLQDRDADGVPEAGEELHRGFGVKTSLAGHDLHGMTWGPDGRLYFSMGDRGYHIELDDGRILEPKMGPGRGAVFRMNADGSDLEVFATGLRNPQELGFDDFGNLFTGDNNGDGGDQARLVYVVEGGETGWAMPYQSLAGDYVRGPWVAERLWETQHATQPAWVLPPVAYIGNGPAGFAHYPGLGLPERYADHFFLCDYGYTNARSGVWSFGVEPKGATFEMVDRHPFAWSMLATDFDFGWDGRMFANIFNQLNMTTSIAILTHAESRSDERVAELKRHVSRPMSEKETPDLVELLEFPDQRLRLRAQFELAARTETKALADRARDTARPLISRIHALWGLAQIGQAGLRAIAPNDLSWAAGESDEFRAQLIRIAGEVDADWLAGDLELALRDPAPRIQFFAAQSLGALGERSSVPSLFDLVRENGDEDVYLRHAVVWALHRMGAVEEAWSRSKDADRSVRMAALLVLRHSADPRIGAFLSDDDGLVQVEAARAIYDLPIDAAMPALAALVGKIEPAADDDTQTSQALHRRVIGANVRLRSDVGAAALASYAVDASQLEWLRDFALEALATYSNPPQRDLAMGFYRPLEAASPEILESVFLSQGRALVASDVGARALEIASEIGQMPLEDEELLELVGSPRESASSRVSALIALAARAEGPEARAAAEIGLDAAEPEVRSAARDLFLAIDESAGVERMIEAASTAEALSERKHAWRRLGTIEDPRVESRLREVLDAWAAGEFEKAAAYEAIDAASKQSNPEMAIRAAALLAPGFDDLVASRSWALEGGDPEAGREVFQTFGDCQRCHGAGGGHDAGVGPSLAGVSSKGAEYVLESILDPQATIAEGFATVVVTRHDGSLISGLLLRENEGVVVVASSGEGMKRTEISRDEIASISEPVTGMPPTGLGLEPAALRDVVSYVMSLE